MYFLQQLAKALATVLVVDVSMFLFGVDPGSAKFGVISSLLAFGAMFYFLYPYMDFIGISYSLLTPGLDTDNPPQPIVWKFLGCVCFVIALICLIVW